MQQLSLLLGADRDSLSPRAAMARLPSAGRGAIVVAMVAMLGGCVAYPTSRGFVLAPPVVAVRVASQLPPPEPAPLPAPQPVPPPPPPPLAQPETRPTDPTPVQVPDPPPDEPEVQSQVVGEAIFLRPVAAKERSVYLEIRSGVAQFDRHELLAFIKRQFDQDGIRLSDNPEDARYWMIVSVQNLDKAEGYAGSRAGRTVAFTLKCDVQLSEWAMKNEIVTVDETDHSSPGARGQRTISVHAEHEPIKQHQTSVLTRGTHAAPYELDQARRKMFQVTAERLSGFFGSVGSTP